MPQTFPLVDLTVIGGGPVGLFAAFYAGMRGMSVRIVDSLPELGGQLTALYPEKYVFDMPGFPKVLAKDLAREMSEQAMQFRPEIILEETASELIESNGSYVIGTSRGLRLPTRTVVISAGAGAFSPTKIGVPREDDLTGKGLYYGVREKAIFEGKRVGIVGGGDSAFDWCLNLEPIAGEITLIHRRDQFRAHEDSVSKVMALPIRRRLFCVVKELHGEERLEGVILENTQTQELERLDLDALIVNVGFKSSLGPIKDWGLELEKNQIRVDHRFETNRKGVFAVGDVCAFSEKLKLIATGVGEATTAVCFAKTYLDPGAKLFPGHSSDMDLPAAH
jgi:thioredoxin reductase (NADPH)